MRAVFLSDAHVDGPDDPVQHALVSVLDGVGADALYLLGDVFHRWWASPRWPRVADGCPVGFFPAYRPVVDALRRCAARGTSLHILPGNHDFAMPLALLSWMGAHALAPGPVEIGGRRIVLAHGDEADLSVRYRLATRLLRGRPFGRVMDGLGPERGWRVLGRLAGRPHAPGRDSRALAEAQRRWALEQDAPLVILGHAHDPAQHDLGGRTLVVLEAFDRARAAFALDDRGAIRWIGT